MRLFKACCGFRFESAEGVTVRWDKLFLGFDEDAGCLT